MYDTNVDIVSPLRKVCCPDFCDIFVFRITIFSSKSKFIVGEIYFSVVKRNDRQRTSVTI